MVPQFFCLLALCRRIFPFASLHGQAHSLPTSTYTVLSHSTRAVRSQTFLENPQCKYNTEPSCSFQITRKVCTRCADACWEQCPLSQQLCFHCWPHCAHAGPPSHHLSTQRTLTFKNPSKALVLLLFFLSLHPLSLIHPPS